VPGHGVQAVVGGRALVLGGPALLRRLGVEPAGPLRAAVERAAARGQAAITMLEQTTPLAVFAVADDVRDESREAVRRLHEQGIEVMTGARVDRIEGENGRVAAVLLENGTRLQTDAVLSAVGVRPLIDFAPKLGLEASRQGIRVDEFFRTNLPDIFAIGDCTETRCLVTGRTVPGKLGSNAGQAARTLALNLTGLEKRPYPGVLNAVVTMLDGLAYGAAGLTEADAEAAQMPVLVSRNENTTLYDNMPHSDPVKVKILYRAEDHTVVGGEIMGRLNPAGFVEVLAQLIERRATLLDVLTMHYSSHPELTPKTSKPYWVFASEKLLFELQQPTPSA
ncbi:MAG: FAD-dependent oxidoreductase, partial [Polyangiaceae bacterium]|nr:FAD-dependent oxidoreductase [Polyangiaceae bacterium]